MPDTGFIIASSAVNDTAAGSIAWTNPGNVTADDGTNATANLSSSSGDSNYLRSSHPFAGILPINAVITGVECRIQVDGSAGRLERVVDIQLHNGTEFIGNAKTPNTTIPDDPTNLDFGGDGDLWGATLNLIQIAFCDNPVQFGWRGDSDGSPATNINADAHWIRVFYQVQDDHPGGGPRDLGGFFNDGPQIPGGKGDFI